MPIPRRLTACCFTLAFSIASVSVAQTKAPTGPSVEKKKETASPSDALTSKAGELYDQGVKDLDAGRWADARASFLAAWALKQHWQIAANLARSEDELGQYAQAAEHYAYYLRESPADRKQKAKALFEKARGKVGEVKVQADRAGADVLVDGNLVGRSPLSEPVFVMPGKHSLQMRVGNEVLAEQSVDATAGGSHDVVLAKAEQARPTQPPHAEGTPQQQPQSPLQSPLPPPNESKLPVRKIVIGTGIGMTAALLGTGVAFAIVSNQHASDARVLREQTRKDAGSEACPTPGHGSPACQQLLELGKDQRLFGNVAIFSFIASGLLGGGTLAYGLVKPKASNSSMVQAVPVVGAGSTGFVVRGSW